MLLLVCTLFLQLGKFVCISELVAATAVDDVDEILFPHFLEMKSFEKKKEKNKDRFIGILSYNELCGYSF